MIIPKVKNLIKDDFSDFIAYQGAVVTRNKTFPIDVFKGGRNWVTGSGKNWTLQDKPIGTTQDVIRTIENLYSTPFYERTKYYSSIEVRNVSRQIRYRIEFFNTGTDRTSDYSGTIEPSSEVQKIEIFGLTRPNYNRIRIQFSPVGGTAKPFSYEYRNVGLWVGNIAQPYSPAPEDGYDYQGIDGAYHIQTIKAAAQGQIRTGVPTVDGNNYGIGVKVHTFNELFARTNQPLIYEYATVNETTNIKLQSNNRYMEFGGGSSLDFIASDPFIIDEQSINTKNVIDIVQLPEISREEKQITILSNDEVIIDDFISMKMSTKGSIYQRNMKYCEVVLFGKHELTSEWINIKRFVASDLVDNGNLQEIDYGDFGVLKSEYDDTTQRTKLTCYDRMLQAQIPYDSEVMNLTYPMTISQVLNRLAIVCKLDLVVNTVNNLYQVIASDLWANQSFTYADVLDHIAQATTSIISIRDNKLEIFNPIENDFTIQGKFNSLKMGETFGKTNIVNVSQEPQHYNKFAPSNALDIPLEDRKELAFSNNPILNQDMQTWADRLYLQTKDLEYATFESSTIGYGIFEIGDMVNVYQANEGVTHRVMITNETFDFKHALVTEIGSNLPMAHKNQYVVETDQVRQGQTTYFIVDQQNGVIKGVVDDVTENTSDIAQLVIEKDNILLSLENVQNEIDNIELTKVYNAYSANSNGVPFYETPRADTEYWGTASAINRPTLASDYAWSLIKGADGTDGTDGENGKSVFMAYADSADGTGFSLTDDTKDWLGLYIGLPPQSTTPSDYNWSPSGYGNAREITRVSLELDSVSGSVDILSTKVNNEADKTAQLRLDVDSIESTVENISNGNLLTNGSGELGFLGWSGGSVAKYVKEILEARTTDLRYLDNLRYNMGFVPMYNRMSLSEWDISFYNNGFDVSPIAFIVPDMEHSYRAKVSKFKPFSIDVLEFNDLNRANALTADKVTNFAFNNAMDYVQFTFTPSTSTQFVRFKYNRTGITTSDRLNIAEVMFNRGQPKEWQPSTNNAMAYSQSTRTQLSNKIEDVVTEVDRVSGDIHNAGVEINARDGVTTYGKKFEVKSEDRTETYMKVTDEGLFVSGNIEAGTVGNFLIQNGVMTYTTGLVQREYTSADVVTVREMLYGSITPNAYQLYIYDVNDNGTIDIDDLMRIYNYTIGIGAKPIKTIRNRVLLGTSTGEITASVLYGANNTVGATSKIVGETITTPLLNVEDIAIAGKRIEVDSNGFMKLVSMV